jgi:hypothetical protein
MSEAETVLGQMLTFFAWCDDVCRMVTGLTEEELNMLSIHDNTAGHPDLLSSFLEDMFNANESIESCALKLRTKLETEGKWQKVTNSMISDARNKIIRKRKIFFDADP